MITFETSDQKAVRRFRIAQFNGRAATVKSGEKTITGHVRSVQEKEACVPPSWTITIIPSAPKSVPAVPRSTPRFRSFAEEDIY
ncbi:MAG TPA: hypothetical protein VEI25_00075 [Paraburkholderia sp.]|nr:hypothetical protein [Paraburkholderia sp.]